jgi:hypothetical protein
MLKDLDEELAGLTSNPSSGGVIHEIEMLEQLIRHAQTFLKVSHGMPDVVPSLLCLAQRQTINTHQGTGPLVLHRLGI